MKNFIFILYGILFGMFGYSCFVDVGKILPTETMTVLDGFSILGFALIWFVLGISFLVLIQSED